MSVERTLLDVDDIRERWFKPEAEGGLGIAQKRVYICEAIDAVIVRPAGPGGGGRAPFRPELLEIAWRTD